MPGEKRPGCLTHLLSGPPWCPELSKDTGSVRNNRASNRGTDSSTLGEPNPPTPDHREPSGPGPQAGLSSHAHKCQEN